MFVIKHTVLLTKMKTKICNAYGSQTRLAWRDVLRVRNSKESKVM